MYVYHSINIYNINILTNNVVTIRFFRIYFKSIISGACRFLQSNYLAKTI